MTNATPWNEATADMAPREREVAEAWRVALNDAESGTQALRAVWPSHLGALDPTAQERLPEALHLLERAWSLLEGLDDSVVGTDYAAARADAGA